jgi:hypothetical protein
MTPEANAIIGLFFALWAHQLVHLYDEEGKRAILWFSLIVALVSVYFLGLALARAIGIVR